MVTRAVGPARLNNKKGSKMSNENQNNNGDKRLDTGTALTNTFPHGFQAIASAYGDYAKKSFEDTKGLLLKSCQASGRLTRLLKFKPNLRRRLDDTFVTRV